MTAEQLTEWWAYYQVEPFGEWRADYRAGIIASTMANINRDPKRKPQPWRPRDFMHFEPAEEKRAADQALLQQQIIAALKPIKKA